MSKVQEAINEVQARINKTENEIAVREAAIINMRSCVDLMTEALRSLEMAHDSIRVLNCTIPDHDDTSEMTFQMTTKMDEADWPD